MEFYAAVQESYPSVAQFFPASETTAADSLFTRIDKVFNLTMALLIASIFAITAYATWTFVIKPFFSTQRAHNENPAAESEPQLPTKSLDQLHREGVERLNAYFRTDEISDDQNTEFRTLLIEEMEQADEPNERLRKYYSEGYSISINGTTFERPTVVDDNDKALSLKDATKKFLLDESAPDDIYVDGKLLYTKDQKITDIQPLLKGGNIRIGDKSVREALEALPNAEIAEGRDWIIKKSVYDKKQDEILGKITDPRYKQSALKFAGNLIYSASAKKANEAFQQSIALPEGVQVQGFGTFNKGLFGLIPVINPNRKTNAADGHYVGSHQVYLTETVQELYVKSVSEYEMAFTPALPPELQQALRTEEQVTAADRAFEEAKLTLDQYVTMYHYAWIKVDDNGMITIKSASRQYKLGRDRD